jgi:hypothetical protein
LSNLLSALLDILFTLASLLSLVITFIPIPFYFDTLFAFSHHIHQNVGDFRVSG